MEKTNLKHKPWWYNMSDLGFHYRITDFQCALGISQLKKLNKFVSQRTKIANKYYNVTTNPTRPTASRTTPR